MRVRHLIPIALIVAIVGATGIVGAQQQTPPGRSEHDGRQAPVQIQPFAQSATGVAAMSFLETFTGNPAAPAPWRPSNWDLQYHVIDMRSDLPTPIVAQHGTDCAPHPSTHQVTQFNDMYFLCRDHLMTSINEGGYGLLVFTPDHMLDFSGGTATVRFEMSTLRTSGRDWVDIWVTPWQDNITLPLEDWLPDLQGKPRNGIHVRMDNWDNDSTFRAAAVRNGVEEVFDTCWWCTIKQGTTPSATTRSLFELQISRTHIKFWMPDHNVVWIDRDIADLGFGSGIVQFGHHSYNPTKDCTPTGPFTCVANTWHWDNVQLSSAVPFYMTRATPDRAYQTDLTPATFTFPAAPQNAYIRFTGLGGNPMEMSLNGGATWQTITAQPTTKATHDLSHGRGFFVPIPAGQTQVQFRGQYNGAWWGSGWAIRDVSVWALTGQVPVTPSPTLVPTSTPVTPSPTLVPTSAPVTPSPTLVPTSTPVTPSPTAIPGMVRCRVQQLRQGNNWDTVREYQAAAC
jgi:hypothetical protein